MRRGERPVQSMEGKRGEPRNKPPYPSDFGYLGKPTVINNVETLPIRLPYSSMEPTNSESLGVKDSHGVKTFSISRYAYSGIYELELGMTAEDFVNDLAMATQRQYILVFLRLLCTP